MEEWKNIKDFPNYRISDLGRIKSVDRTVFNKGNNSYCKVFGRVLKTCRDKSGYEYISLTRKSNGNEYIRKTFKIHRLVAFHFVDGYSDGLEVNHKDGVRDNNVATNLEWVTRSGNAKHRFKLGYRIPSGDDGYTSKLKTENCPIILTLYDSGVSQSIIAKAFNVSQSSISNLITGRTKFGLIDQGKAIDKTKL